MKITREQFISVLTDCKGYSFEEAETTAIEYRDDIQAFVFDIGGDEESMKSVRKFLGK